MAHENELVNVLGLKSSLLLFKNTYISSSTQADWNQTDSTAADYIKNKPLIIEVEHVTVTVSTTNSTSVEGLILLLNGDEYTLDSTGIVEIDITVGTQYDCGMKPMQAWETPEHTTYTASQASRNISIVLSPLANGVYAYYSDGSIRSTGTSDAIGVAVITSSHRFGIDKLFGGSTYYQTSFGSSGITTTTSESVAKSILSGKSDTEKILKGSASNVQPAVLASRRLNGKGYIPAFGELWIAYNNIAAIDAMLNSIGGSTLSGNTYWSSTLYDDYKFWVAYMLQGYFGSDKVACNSSYSRYWRAFFPI